MLLCVLYSTAVPHTRGGGGSLELYFFVSRGSLQIWCQRDCASLPFPPSVAFFGSCSYAQVAFLLLPPRGRKKD